MERRQKMEVRILKIRPMDAKDVALKAFADIELSEGDFRITVYDWRILQHPDDEKHWIGLPQRSFKDLVSGRVRHLPAVWLPSNLRKMVKTAIWEAWENFAKQEGGERNGLAHFKEEAV
jgi:hypothetical protein